MVISENGIAHDLPYPSFPIDADPAITAGVGEEESKAVRARDRRPDGRVQLGNVPRPIFRRHFRDEVDAV